VSLRLYPGVVGAPQAIPGWYMCTGTSTRVVYVHRDINPGSMVRIQPG